MQRLSREQRERVMAYAQAPVEMRETMREQENALGQQSDMQAIRPQEHQKQMNREYQRGGFER